jgi:hypothetical protein
MIIGHRQKNEIIEKIEIILEHILPERAATNFIKQRMPRRNDAFNINFRTGELVASPHLRPSDRSLNDVINEETLETLSSRIDYIVVMLSEGASEGTKIVDTWT